MYTKVCQNSKKNNQLTKLNKIKNQVRELTPAKQRHKLKLTTLLVYCVSDVD